MSNAKGILRHQEFRFFSTQVRVRVRVGQVNRVSGAVSGVVCSNWSQDMIITHVWQSRVEIEGYSVAYFDRIAVLEAPYH